MIRRSLLVLLLIGSLTGVSCAQKEQQAPHQSDSLTLAQAPWQTDTLDGMVLRTVRFTRQEYLSANHCISLVELPAATPRRCTLAFSWRPRRTLTSRQAADEGAIAAVNGSFFDMDYDNPICYLRIGKKEISKNLPGSDPVNRKYYQTGTICLSPDGRVEILRTLPALDWEATHAPGPDVMTAGPLLIYHDTMQAMRQDRSFVAQRHNRTALGIRADGSVLLIVVDGRAKEAAGMSLDELALTMHYLGCETAVNLDGGGSTTLWVKGQPHGGIVNYPSDNGKFDHQGERKVSSCILVMPAAPAR